MTRADVLIVGAGPIGLTLANLLGRRGVSVIVAEKQPAPYALPRAIHFDGEAMRVFQAAGLAEAVLPHTMVGRGMLFQNAAGETLIDWSREQTPGPNGWFESYRCHQPGVEEALAAGIERFASVDLRRGVEVVRSTQVDGGVIAELADGDRIEAGYLVGCDGADSRVRSGMGGGLEDLGFNERWLVADLMLTRPRPDLGDYSIQFCDPEAPATYVRGVGDRRRWEMRLTADDPAQPDEAFVFRRLARWITPEDAALERAAVYTFRSALAAPWTKGSIFLAGDAAHQMPPFMGQGMCAGLRDVGNLAWKLALAVKTGDDAPLATYEAERAHNVRQFIELSVRLGRLINQTAAGEAPQGKMASIWPALGPGLGRRSDVSGRLAPQPLAPDGRLADDAADGGFHLLARRAAEAPIPVFEGAADWLRSQDLAAVIVRPDGYVLDEAGTEDALVPLLKTYQPLFALNQAAPVC